jgi:hypothetical protein
MGEQNILVLGATGIKIALISLANVSRFANVGLGASGLAFVEEALAPSKLPRLTLYSISKVPQEI